MQAAACTLKQYHLGEGRHPEGRVCSGAGRPVLIPKRDTSPRRTQNLGRIPNAADSYAKLALWSVVVLCLLGFPLQ